MIVQLCMFLAFALLIAASGQLIAATAVAACGTLFAILDG